MGGGDLQKSFRPSTSFQVLQYQRSRAATDEGSEDASLNMLELVIAMASLTHPDEIHIFDL